MKSSILLAGASVLALSSGIGSAQAAAVAPTVVYGGGSTLAAKVYRDIFNCFSTAANGVFASTPDNPSNVTYPTTEAAGCSTQGTSKDVYLYEPVGSGAGLSAWTTATPSNFGSPATTNTIAYLDSAVGVSTTPYTEITFAASDAYLTSTQTAAQAAAADGNYGSFQVPTFATPITLPIGSVQNVKLKTADICNLFGGVTNTAEGVTFSELVVRSDGSGTSFIFSDWLAQNCPSSLGFNSSNNFPSTKPSWSAVIAANNTGSALTLVTVSGSGGVASTVASTSNAIGYVSPDYVYPIVSNTAYPAYVNGFLPSVANTKAQLAKITYPKTYNAQTVGQQINDAIVAPPANGKYTGYGIAGFTFVDAYECYAKSANANIGVVAQGTALKQVLATFYVVNGNDTNILTANGFVQAPSAVKSLLSGTDGPLNASSGIQNASCPKT